MPLIPHPQGDYLFLPGISPYSCGVVSAPGFEIAHVTFRRPIAYRRIFDLIEQHLKDQGRPKAALCGIELRSPRPFTFSGFAEFNAGYAKILEDWGLFVDGINPVARTNVAPEVDPPSEPVLFGFSYTRPCDPSLSTNLRGLGRWGAARGNLGSRGDHQSWGYIFRGDDPEGVFRNGPDGNPASRLGSRLVWSDRRGHLHGPSSGENPPGRDSEKDRFCGGSWRPLVFQPTADRRD